MRPLTDKTLESTLTSIRAEDSAAAMQVLTLGEYQVCFNDGSSWRNTGIALYLQDQLLGLAVAGIRNAGGTRSAVAKSDFYNVSLEYFPGGGRERMSGDELLFVEAGKRCDALTEQERAAGQLSSGVLTFDGASVSGVQHIPSMHPIWYQVFYQPGAPPGAPVST
jgi:hypothetical protein